MENQSSPFTLLALRLAPFYVWLGILSMQPHKEERFMFPVYPLMCFNAAVSVYLIRGWMEVAYIKLTHSPYQVSGQTPYILLLKSCLRRPPKLEYSATSPSPLSSHPPSYLSPASSLYGTTTTRR